MGQHDPRIRVVSRSESLEGVRQMTDDGVSVVVRFLGLNHEVGIVNVHTDVEWWSDRGYGCIVVVSFFVVYADVESCVTKAIQWHIYEFFGRLAAAGGDWRRTR